MASGNFVTYARVSTAKQGRSGLGLEAQREAVARFLDGGRWRVVAEFVEVESGKRADRPELAKAIEACRLYGARLVVAKLDRLSRDPGFLRDLQRSGVDFVAADMPDANKLTVGIMALVAEQEREAISARTKAALAAAKARGTVLGGFRGRTFTEADHAAAAAGRKARGDRNAARLMPIIAELRAAGIISANGIARVLSERGIPTAQGATAWRPTQVQRVLARVVAAT
ncbi:recombinase family protein [Methylobacterium nodulans]|uniref:Resolvase domain protein n=1 Tax=Methylobacterium nodulans (strain LMG 21967 / CNCM I-2342 / ORS 2060) TaxID=460265 RepID=B8IXX6_METNO|nr:recombinase family protein [Methylobacterium nodulans]ACL63266.1 Resolvase domain protein [Methylobacterium nodulans ORS 2060]